jgi:Uma2 family endonuclease
MIELVDNPCVRIPAWVTNLETFRRWVFSEEFPEQGRIAFFRGYTWVDLSMETWDHNRVKTRIISCLDRLGSDQGLGKVSSDRMRLTHPEADLSTEPDGMFLSKESFQHQRVQLARGGDSIEVVGSPDMVLEVISTSSERKDTVELLELYWKAGIQEYWIVDVRKGALRFDILKHGPRGYSAVRKQKGWVKSPVFHNSFRLVRTEGELGLSEFTLEIR